MPKSSVGAFVYGSSGPVNRVTCGFPAGGQQGQKPVVTAGKSTNGAQRKKSI
jgi:hypothetical protein